MTGPLQNFRGRNMIDYENKFEEEVIQSALLSGTIATMKSQLKAKNTEIDELKVENEAESKRAKDNFDTAIKFRDGPKGMVAYSEMAGKLQQRTKERDNHFRDIIKLENELSELKDEVDKRSEFNLFFTSLKLTDELTALQSKISNGIQVDIAYTGSTNIITNLPNALYGKFILLGLNEMEDDDDLLE